MLRAYHVASARHVAPSGHFPEMTVFFLCNASRDLLKPSSDWLACFSIGRHRPRDWRPSLRESPAQRRDCRQHFPIRQLRSRDWSACPPTRFRRLGIRRCGLRLDATRSAFDARLLRSATGCPENGWRRPGSGPREFGIENAASESVGVDSPINVVASGRWAPIRGARASPRNRWAPIHRSISSSRKRCSRIHG